MELKGKTIWKVFRLLKKEIKKTLKEYPNYRIKIDMTLDIENTTDADIKIIIDKSKLLLD